MSNVFKNKTAAKEKIEEDFIGGGGVFDTDIYPAKIKHAYIRKSNSDGSKAMAMSLCLLINGRELNTDIWMTNSDGDVTYKDKKTGEKRNLPGFNQVNSLAMLTLSKEIGDLDVEEKTLQLYDFEAKALKPTSVECFVELHDLDIHVAIQRQTVDKNEKGDDGKYHPTGDTRDVNQVVKFFPEAGLVTISEVAWFIKNLGGDFDEVLSDGDLNKAISKMGDDGEWASKWLERNKGQTWDRSTKKEGKSFGGGTSTSDTSSKTKKSDLFDD